MREVYFQIHYYPCSVYLVVHHSVNLYHLKYYFAFMVYFVIASSFIKRVIDSKKGR